jgi:sigma-B regulation protein RsbU (phosphoserine phosphatase)
MASLLDHFSKQSTRSLLLRGYLTVALVTIADYLTGPDLSFLIFYIFPIITVSWFLGKKNGVVMAIVAALATLAHDLFRMEMYAIHTFGDLIPYWAFLQRLLVFLTVGLVVSALRSSEDEKRQVEHKVARQVQSFFVPRTMPSLSHFNYSAHSKPSDHLSGDLFDCFLVGADKLAFMVGDICGKGISAALLMAYMQGVLRSYAPIREENLAEMMAIVNRALYVSTADDKFATLFMGIYDDTHRSLTYVNAGHDAPRVLRWKQNGHAAMPSAALVEVTRDVRGRQQDAAGVDVLKLERGGLLLGVDPEEQYVAHVMQLQRGDILVCETDGVQEASNYAGDHYGDERLTAVVSGNRRESSHQIHSLILKDIQQFVGAGPQVDDMTLLVGKVL